MLHGGFNLGTTVHCPTALVTGVGLAVSETRTEAGAVGVSFLADALLAESCTVLQLDRYVRG